MQESKFINPDNFNLANEIQNEIDYFNRQTDYFVTNYTADYGNTDVDLPAIKFIEKNEKDNLVRYSASANLLSNRHTFIYFTYATGDTNEKALLYNKPRNEDPDQFDELLIHALYLITLQLGQEQLSKTNTIVSLAKLIYYQNEVHNQGQNYNTNDDKDIPTSDFVKGLKAAIGNNIRTSAPLNVYTFANLIYRLRHHQTLTLGQTIWLLSQTRNDISFLSNYVTLLNLDQYIGKQDKVDPDVLTMVNKMKQDGDVKDIIIHPIINQHPQTQYSHHFVGIHGTNAFSVPSILQTGLKDILTLRAENNQSYEYTGSGFGNGIYFARLTQYEKALNYTSSRDATTYAFVCDVSYEDKFETTHFGEPNVTSKQNLIVGHGVGSYDRDEIVARSWPQVQIKYLLEIQTNNDY